MRCTRTLTAGSGNLNRFVRHLRRGQTGCLRGTLAAHLTIRNGGFRVRSAQGNRAKIVGVVSFSHTAHNVVLANVSTTSSASPSVRINGRGITIRRSDITNGHTGICDDCGRLPATNHDHSARANCLWNGAAGQHRPDCWRLLAIGNKVANPGFVDRAKDFRLQPGSPCAGMGPQ